MTQPTDQDRAEFEREMKAIFSHTDFELAPEGHYKNPITGVWLLIWQAARRAQVVPQKHHQCTECNDTGVGVGHGYDCTSCYGTLPSVPQPATSQQGVQPVAWLAEYVDREGNSNWYVSTHKDLATENDMHGAPKPLYTHPTTQVLEQFIEQAGDVHFQRCRVGSATGAIRWDVEFGYYGAEVRGKTLQEAVAKALAAQAKKKEQT